MARQTWKERMEDKQDGMIQTLMAFHERMAQESRESAERHEKMMREADARHSEIMARVARLNGKDHS